MRRTVAILMFPDVEVLDFTGPFEVFAVADELNGYGSRAAHRRIHGIQPGAERG
ncbi:MAG: hypothetical protein ACLFNX_06760 [Spirochaetaceae bacterium]